MSPLPKLPPEIEDKLLDVLTYLEDYRGLDHYAYTGINTTDENIKPYIISFGGTPLVEIVFNMNQKQDGVYDGLEGLSMNYFIEENK